MRGDASKQQKVRTEWGRENTDLPLLVFLRGFPTWTGRDGQVSGRKPGWTHQWEDMGKDISLNKAWVLKTLRGLCDCYSRFLHQEFHVQLLLSLKSKMSKLSTLTHDFGVDTVLLHALLHHLKQSLREARFTALPI